MQESVFTKIVRGEIPCFRVYEDAKTLAFLDIHPVTPGHTLIIPKKQVEFVWDLDDEDYGAVMNTTKRVALRIRDVLGSTYVHERIVGSDVPHAHVHVMPFETSAELHYRPASDTKPDDVALAAMARRLWFT